MASYGSQNVAGRPPERRGRLNERLRAAFIEGAEEDSQRRLGRGLTQEDLSSRERDRYLIDRYGYTPPR